MKIILVILVVLVCTLISTPLLAQDRHSELTNIVFTIYDGLRDTITNLLNATIFKQHPELASYYGDAITLLTSFSAIWILLVVVAAVRKVIGWILLAGWVLLGIAIMARIL